MKDEISVLDLGCGDGSFIKALIESGVKGVFRGVDLSYNMASQALQLFGRESSDLLVADGFNLPILPEITFDLIHIDSVLHHLIARNRAGSKKLAQKLLMLLFGRLSENSIIIVEEMYYNSFIFAEFTSAVIFYGLKLMNELGLNLSVLRKEFQSGLEVNFYSKTGLESIFSQHSKRVHEIGRYPAKVPKFYRIFLLRDFGRISYVLYR